MLLGSLHWCFILGPVLYSGAYPVCENVARRNIIRFSSLEDIYHQVSAQNEHFPSLAYNCDIQVGILEHWNATMSLFNARIKSPVRDWQVSGVAEFDDVMFDSAQTTHSTL